VDLRAAQRLGVVDEVHGEGREEDDELHGARGELLSFCASFTTTYVA
jgi:hypothetical protein